MSTLTCFFSNAWGDKRTGLEKGYLREYQYMQKDYGNSDRPRSYADSTSAISSERKPNTVTMDQSGDYPRSPNSSSDTNSPNPTSNIPTCIVAPTSSNTDKDPTSDGSNPYIPTRKQREFIPENRKDDHYWEKRRKNNEAARKSREKRRFHDVVLENRIMELTRENCQIRNELFAIKKHFGIPLNETFDINEDNKTTATKSKERSLSPVSNHHTNASMSYLAAARASGSILHGSQPPTMVPMQSSIPLPISLQGNYNSKGPMSYFIAAVPSSGAPENYQGQLSSNSIGSSHMQEKLLQHSPKSSNVEDLVINRRQMYLSGESNETQGRQLHSSQSTSLPSQYSLSNTSANIQAAAAESNPSSVKEENILPTDYTSDDHTQDEPLSLTVRKRGDSFSGNESSVSYSSPDSPVSQSPPTMALPHKLRHKVPMDFGAAFQSAAFGPMVNGLTQLSEIALAQSGPLPLVKKSKLEDSDLSPRSGRMNQRSLIDPKYAERRRRNNEAARRCRENRKSITRMREAKSDYLETENGKLRHELDTLQDEMKQLKDMIDRKKTLKSEPQEDENMGNDK
ncbi:nuclear factor interleukin-3-regulated protein-like isoform X1 [Saccostrea echinata]|uniref:nuclear factor interleukin-3-regulated protein-like isoform X1 n=2 Tax=Saccostrea echinata TaxID=191078 RepID=UPI002A8190A5|nr:nuclear factor interleukin-3-regulated protein-like isoform X1 [Saccostrea echinata]